MARQLTDLQKLTRDAIQNPSIKFGEKSVEDGLREAIIEAVGGQWNRYSFMDNKGKFFQVIAEVLALPMQEVMEGLFGDNINVETIEAGDMKVVTVEDNQLFKVATIASGNNDIRRQRVMSNKVTVETDKLAVKVYEDFDRFIAGKVNLTGLMERIKKSFALEVSKKVYQAVKSGYDAVANQNYSKIGTFSEDVMDEVISRIEAKTGLKVALYGTKKALGKISRTLCADVGVSDAKKDEYFALGHYSNYKGSTPMYEIPTMLEQGTDEFFDTEDCIFILPVGMDIINVVYEGDPIVDEATSPTARNDQQIEFLFEQRVGVAVLIANYYGIYKLV